MGIRSSSLGFIEQTYGMLCLLMTGCRCMYNDKVSDNADTSRSIADVFRIQVVSNNDVRSPIVTLGSTSFFHVRVNNVYVVAVTKFVCSQALVPLSIDATDSGS